VNESAFSVTGTAATWTDLADRRGDDAEAVARARSVTDHVSAQFQAHQGAVFRYLKYACGNPCDAEEITQETFFKLYRVLAQGTRIDNTLGWLFIVARNLAIDKRRNKRFRYIIPVLDQVWRRLSETVADTTPTSEEVLLEATRRDRVHAAMRCLTDLQRQVLHLRSEGLLYREIADILGISVQGAADALQRAVSNIRHRLEE
jgi:RNA polymerase sigma-70 factor (ECF subfamily)